MFGRSLLARCALVATCLLALGCSHKGPPPPPKIALVASVGGFADRSFNAAARAGFERCASGGRIQLQSAAPASAAEYETQLALLATQNYDPVVAVGDAQARDLERIARRFESTRFAIIGGVVDEPNVASVTFKEQDGSFVAGALAALVTRTRNVAFLGGADIARLHAAEAGFVAGVREVDPRVAVRLRYVGSFADADGAYRSARRLYASGTDVIYVVAGPAGTGALTATRSARNAYAIGVDANQDAVAPGRVLTSIVKRVDRAAERICLETVGQKPMSGRLELSFADGGLELTKFTYSRAIVGDANLRRLQSIRRALEAGVVTPPATAAELARFKPVVIR